MRTPVLALALVLAACGGGDDSASPDAGPDYLDPPPPEGGQQLTTAEYTLQPGEEKYLCYTFYSPADGEHAITKVEPIPGLGVHHILLSKARSPEDEAPHECPELVKTSWEPIYAVGAGMNNALTLPEGTGFKMGAWSQYVVQLHLQNVTDQPITERAAVNLTYAPDATDIIPASLFVQGTFELSIPAHATDYSMELACASPLNMHLFAIMPHMHKLGKKLELRHGTVDAMNMVYAKDPWAFGDQPMDPLDLEVAVGDQLRTTCTWDNPTDQAVSFGESSDNEMCFSVMYYYPAPDGVSGCF